jgi:hypothetical protein
MYKLIFVIALFLSASAFSLSDVADYFYTEERRPAISFSQIADLTDVELANTYDDIKKRIQNRDIADIIASVQNTDCTTQLAAECALDIEKTVKACAAAFETQGGNIIADIKCAKDLLADKKTCWPCICFEAEKKGWKIIGC